MQTKPYHELKKESHFLSQFNDSEYERWSEGIKATKSPKTQLGIEGFLGTNENLQAGREDISMFLQEISKGIQKRSPILFGYPVNGKVLQNSEKEGAGSEGICAFSRLRWLFSR
jgi:ABC-type xylose transport system substrate-binding protein